MQKNRTSYASGNVHGNNAGNHFRKSILNNLESKKASLQKEIDTRTSKINHLKQHYNLLEAELLWLMEIWRRYVDQECRPET